MSEDEEFEALEQRLNAKPAQERVNLEQAARQALEALEHEAEVGNDDAYRAERDALRRALANSALDKMAENERELGIQMEPERQEPVGEAYLCDKCSTPFDGAYYCPECGHNTATKEPVYTSPPAREPEQQEPVARVTSESENQDVTMSWWHEPALPVGTPLYTRPQAREPQYDKTAMNIFVQNLYDEKMREGKHGHYETMFHVVHRAIKAAHQIGVKE